MQKLTKSGAVESDDWTVIAANNEAPQDDALDKPHLLPAACYNADFEAYKDQGSIGFWLDSDADITEITHLISTVKKIGINFPAFADGRGFSLARSLRESYQYRGEIIALGNFMQDQLYYLKRCGFDSFKLDNLDQLESMRSSLDDFSESYQGACDQPLPLFRRRN